MGKCLISAGGLVADEDLDAATATADDVLAGKTFLAGGESELQTGRMPEKGAWSSSVAMNGSVVVPAGHHNGGGKVNGPAITDRGAWNDSVGMNTWITVPQGYHNGNGWVNGPSITDHGAWTNTIDPGKFVYIPQGYHNGSGWVQARAVNANDAIAKIKYATTKDRYVSDSHKYILGVANVEGVTMSSNYLHFYLSSDHHTATWAEAPGSSWTYAYIDV